MVKKTKATVDLAFGDLVAAQVGFVEWRQVVLDLSPEITGYLVYEPTTGVFPIEDIRRVDAA